MISTPRHGSSLECVSELKILSRKIKGRQSHPVLVNEWYLPVKIARGVSIPTISRGNTRIPLVQLVRIIFRTETGLRLTRREGAFSEFASRGSFCLLSPPLVFRNKLLAISAGKENNAIKLYILQ